MEAPFPTAATSATPKQGLNVALLRSLRHGAGCPGALAGPRALRPPATTRGYRVGPRLPPGVPAGGGGWLPYSGPRAGPQRVTFEPPDVRNRRDDDQRQQVIRRIAHVHCVLSSFKDAVIEVHTFPWIDGGRQRI